MFGTLYHFAKKYGAPQLRGTLLDSQLFITAAFAAFMAYKHFYPAIIRYELVAQFVNYNFMAFGFTVAALAIVFALPNKRFINLMFEASSRMPGRGQGPWEDALFLMTWNGIIHFAALIAMLAAMAFSYDLSKDHTPFAWDVYSRGTQITYGLLIWLQSYALIQFLMTLFSIFFFCSSYVRQLRQEWEQRSHEPG